MSGQSSKHVVSGDLMQLHKRQPFEVLKNKKAFQIMAKSKNKHFKSWIINEKFASFRRCPIRTFFRIQAPDISTINPNFTKPCTVEHAYPVDYSHDLSWKTRAYLWNIITLNFKTGIRKRTFETFLAAVTNNGSADCFAVNMRWLRELKLCNIAYRWLLCLIIVA